jgi:hypothetical protein
MAAQRDRMAALLASSSLNGIDFIEIASSDQRTLRVHFLNDVAVKGTVTSVSIEGGETVPVVPVKPIVDATDWSSDAEGRPVLTLQTPIAGDFSYYTLTLTSPKLDHLFDHSRFSFKANCPADLDCRVEPPPCPEDDEPLPPIDYLAKDFLSFRQALSDFSAVRYPEWVERSEADVGVMVMETLAALGDDLSYTQDRINAEATLATATERRSIVRHARLVDYEPRPATSAQVLLQLNVTAGPIPPGVVVSARGADGETVEFETGTGLRDASTYPARPQWNGARPVGGVPTGGIDPYIWDDSQRCLHAGATQMWVHKHGFAFYEGQELLVDTRGPTSADPPVREVVRLVSTKPGHGDFAVEEIDPLFLEGGQPAEVTHIRWRAEDALRHDHDLDRTTLAGNLVPATQGRRFTETFAITAPPATAPNTPLALVRTGPGSVPWDRDGPKRPQYLYTLQAGQLAWLGDDPGVDPEPEIALVQKPAPPDTVLVPWAWRRSLLRSERFEQSFTVDEAAYRRIRRNRDTSSFDDYDGWDGDTIRFGDGLFGEIPEDGAVFRVTYRTGAGVRGNVAAGAIATVAPGTPHIVDVTNPFPANYGAAEEAAERVRRLAPQAFRAKQFRAVRREDYQEAARTLRWVDKAGTVFRWTGSWLTVFTTADANDVEILPPVRRGELVSLLNRYRLAGYESYVPDPVYASLDLIIRVCACPSAFRSDLKEDVLRTLGTRPLPDGRQGFFSPARFTFGDQLERSALEAAIQDAPGVAGVIEITYRRRGQTAGFVPMPDTVPIGMREIVRVDNDPNRPEAGSLKVRVEGGK